MEDELNTNSYVVELIDTFDEFLKLKDSWNRLSSSRKNISVFFSFDFFRLYFSVMIDSFENVKIKVFVVKNQAGRVVSIFPFLFEEKTYFRFFKFRMLSLKDPNRVGFFHFLVDRDEPVELIFKSFVDFLKGKKVLWDVVRFFYIPETEQSLAQFKKVCSQEFIFEEIATESLRLKCDGSFQEYKHQMMSKKDLKNIKRRIRRFSEFDRFEFVEFNEKEDVEKKLEILFNIEDNSWKGRANSSMIRTYQADFHRKLVTKYAKENMVKLFFLRVNDDYVSGKLTIVDNGVCYFLKSGYDEGYYRFSPSSVLTYLILDRLFHDDQINQIDFFGPYYRYENQFGKQTRKRKNIYLYNKNPVAMLYLLLKKLLLKLPFIRVDETGFPRFGL